MSNLILQSTDNISRKILAKFGGRWPNSVTLMTYFSFLYNFCYKPYFADIIHAKGIVFDNNPNIKIPQDSMRYYLSPSGLLYSNRLPYSKKNKSDVLQITGAMILLFQFEKMAS